MDGQAGHPRPPTGDRTECRLHAALAPAELAAVATVRHRLRAALGDWGVPELADTAELLASELVTNALQHTAHGAVLDAVLDADLRLRVEVRDDSGQVPRPRRSAQTATSGRGLVLVEALADAWGVRLGAEGKVTWFELAMVGVRPAPTEVTGTPRPGAIAALPNIRQDSENVCPDPRTRP